MFKKILIANRGEIALRIIRTCKEMGIKTVAVYSKADAESLHVRFADEAVCIGPAPSSESYLKIPNIIAAAEITNSDAIHPGYGFLSENAKFSRVCAENNIKFIGASGDMIDAMGDKASAKMTMKAAGVPTIPGSDGLIKDLKHGKAMAIEIGYPVMIKATAGGGGKGMKVIWEEQELEESLSNAMREAEAAFGNSGMYMEKFIEDPRHIEIQIAGDQFSTFCHMSERDCSIQRRHQKLVEETPSPFMTKALRKAMGEAAIKAASAVDYEGVGTVEFLVDKHRNFYFMEMNTRIQVEHPVSEMVTGIDLIKEQIRVCAGEKLSIKQSDVVIRGHSFECRINAEDPKTFMPCPGLVKNYHPPGGLGVRVDSHLYSGYTVPPNYDSMVAKVITHGETREIALNRMRHALDETIVDGIRTNIPLQQRILSDGGFEEGGRNIHYLEKRLAERKEKSLSIL